MSSEDIQSLERSISKLRQVLSRSKLARKQPEHVHAVCSRECKLLGSEERVKQCISRCQEHVFVPVEHYGDDYMDDKHMLTNEPELFKAFVGLSHMGDLPQEQHVYLPRILTMPAALNYMPDESYHRGLELLATSGNENLQRQFLDVLGIRYNPAFLQLPHVQQHLLPKLRSMLKSQKGFWHPHLHGTVLYMEPAVPETLKEEDKEDGQSE